MPITVSIICLAAILATAAAAKSADGQATRDGLVAIGWPKRLQRLWIVVPLAEGGVAAMLLLAATRPLGLAAAIVLHLGFAGVLLANLSHGRAPPCPCFGRLYRERLSWGVVGINLASATIALLQLAGTPALRLSGDAMAVGVIAVLASTVLRKRAARLIVGAPAPRFHLPAAEGGYVTLEALLAHRRPVLLVFVEAGCWHCAVIARRAAEWLPPHADRCTLAFITRREAVQDYAAPVAAGAALLIDDNEAVAGRYGCQRRPSAVLIRANGRIDLPLVSGRDEVWSVFLHAQAPVPRQ